MHTPWLDYIMFHATDPIYWLPVYLFFLFLVIRKYRWNTLWIILFIAIMILISDQMTNLVKELTHRLRPSQESGLVVHLVNAYKGGNYGFYSAHASNNFALALFLIVVLGRYYRFIFIPLLLWALLMSYTRIYLGVHYPGDILAGMVVGSVIGFMTGKICLRAITK